MDKATNTGVPNSDADFGKNYGDPPKVLASKITNADAYIKNMKEKGGAILAYTYGYVKTYIEATKPAKNKPSIVALS